MHSLKCDLTECDIAIHKWQAQQSELEKSENILASLLSSILVDSRSRFNQSKTFSYLITCWNYISTRNIKVVIRAMEPYQSIVMSRRYDENRSESCIDESLDRHKLTARWQSISLNSVFLSLIELISRFRAKDQHRRSSSSESSKRLKLAANYARRTSFITLAMSSRSRFAGNSKLHDVTWALKSCAHCRECKRDEETFARACMSVESAKDVKAKSSFLSFLHRLNWCFDFVVNGRAVILM